MILDLVEKTPDALIGIVLAGGLWLGFNYAVLAERAMDRVAAAEIVPRCVAELDAAERQISSLLAPLDELSSMPMVGPLMQDMTRHLTLPAGASAAICACGAARAATGARFDYALHTASFRLIEPDAVSSLRADALTYVRSQACGALPWLN